MQTVSILAPSGSKETTQWKQALNVSTTSISSTASFMQFIFNRSFQQERSLSVSPQWSHTRSGLSRNLSQVINYYHSRSFAVKSNHLLVRLLNTPRLNYEAPLERFYEAIDVISNNLARSYEFTSPVSVGKAHDGVFYGPGTLEAIIGSNENFDVHESATQWKHQSPVRVIYHEKTDIDMHLPNGMSYSTEKGCAVVCINIPMLFVMYRGFVLEQLAALRRGQQPKVAAQFVHGYVLPNMIASHLDFALFNRTLVKASGSKPAIGTSRKHAIALPNWVSQTDRVIDDTLTNIARTNPTFHDMLCMIPTVSEINGSQTMRLPALSPVYQYAWVELMARARVVAGCIVMSPSRLLQYDRTALQQIRQAIAYEGMTTNFTNVFGTNSKDIMEMVEIIKLTK